jgi:DNA-binding XRE family transcriptional regulator
MEVRIMKLNKLAGARVTKDLTQQEMAQKIGISKNNYSKKEIGKNQFTLTEIIKILEILESKFEDIFI